MREAMQNPNGISVSKEEEQFLRQAFRRFALPYVLVFAAVAWITTNAMSKEAPSGSSEDVSSLREQVAKLEKSVAALEGRLGKIDGELERAGSRVGALESRKPTAVPATGDTAATDRALRDVTKRISDLERRNSSSATAAERIDALAARMQRIEGAARSAATSPAPAAAPTPAPAAPAPASAP
jgi:predicted RNase H-like nuclease (RuvC/YqgF family)